MSRPLKRVSKSELRELFNRGAYSERVKQGEFVEDVERSSEIAASKRQKLGMPTGSVSQIVAYRLPVGTKIALVHQYVRPNGEIRGRPDPKYLLIDGVIHAPYLKASEARKSDEQAATKTIAKT